MKWWLTVLLAGVIFHVSAMPSDARSKYYKSTRAAKKARRSDKGFQRLILKAHSEELDLRRRQRICFFLEGGRRPIACGRIYSVRGERVFLKLFYQKQKISNNQSYYIAKILKKKKSKKKGYGFSKKVFYQVLYERRMYRYQLGLGTLTGYLYLYPNLQVFIGLGRKFALGIKACYANFVSPSATLRAIGVLLMADYYFGRERFKGLYAQLGLGEFIFAEGDGATTDPSVYRPAGSIALGYRFRKASSGFNIGASAGIMYYGNPTLRRVVYDSHGLLSLLSVDIGFVF